MQTFKPLQPPLLKKTDTRIRWGGLLGSSASLAVSQLAQQQRQPLLLIAPDIQAARRFEQELHFFLQNTEIPILLFPDWETLPYDHFSPHQDLISERLYSLYRFPLLTQGIMIAALPTLMHRLMPKAHLQTHSLALAIGDTLTFNTLREQLVTTGYHAVNQVMEHGEFAIRGAIMDIYPMGSRLPFRLELLDDQIDTIRSFNPEDQRSLEKLTEIRLLPAREYPLTEENVTQFRQNWRAKFAGNPTLSVVYQRISAKEPIAGAEYYLPLFYPQLASLFDYLPGNTQLIMIDELLPIAELFWQEINYRFKQLAGDITRPLCEPEEICIPPNELFKFCKSFPQIQLCRQDSDQQVQVHFETQAPEQFIIDYHAQQPWQPLKHYLDQFQGRVLFCAESSGRREVLLDILAEIDITPAQITSWQDFLSSSHHINLTVSELDNGMQLTDPALSVITESQLFGQQVMQRRLRNKPQQDAQNIIRHLTELQLGAPVVHIDYGVGRYRGLELISTDEQTNEYLTLEYADGDKIYVPITALHLISRYTGMDAEHAPLQKLGSKKWQLIKDKVAKQVADTAAELLAIYSQREATTGFSFQAPDQDFNRFRQSFPFEETPDQHRAINEVIQDMTSKKCMDRLVCGDVGFGKTEVAIQAAFLAVQSNKQVVVLVPTTLLANQHHQTFQDRLADWPIKIAELSRLRNAQEQKNTLAGLSKGTIDIVIGTHKLLSNTIKFKDLGLLIVDEEHRFGVKQKERIKALRAHVDILTLTATPIPRTLNMALSGMRDLSIIATPPAKRLAIKTFVHEYQNSIIREAILRETLRGGQLFYLHNEVATIHAQAEKLRQIIPEIRVAVAHGQMHERELEKVMIDFYHQRFNVLLCTTIVESGIDVPTANTIIINKANHFGLAQLHQLRGRVGRSHHQAYAYLLVENKATISKDAQKRLAAIEQLEELGVGFHLATHDLEIRGAGELLGEEQSGHIEAVGFSLYMEMLDEAVNALKAQQDPIENLHSKHTTEINLHISAFIPETYIDDINLRLSFYKQIASCRHKAELQELKVIMIDRFGLLPVQLQQLFNVTELKLQAEKLGILKIDANQQFAYLHFSEQPKIDPGHVIKLIQQDPQHYQLQSNHLLRYRLAKHTNEERYSLVSQLLTLLQA